MSPKSEDKAHEAIDRMLEQAGWHVRDDKDIFKHAERLRQAILKRSFADKLTATKERISKTNNVE